MADFSPRAAALLRAGRQASRATQEDCERNLAALRTRLGGRCIGEVDLTPAKRDPPALLVQDDATLALALISGDPRATRVAWRRFSPMVRQFTERLLGPRDVDDLVQDVFVSFFDRVKTLQDPKALKAFILSIAANRARHEVRRRKVGRFLCLDADPPPVAVHFDPEAREALVRFYQILDRLGADDRTAFVLRFVEEMDLEGVASSLDISLSTVKRRLTRCWHKVAVQVQRDAALSHYWRRRRSRDEDWSSPSASYSIETARADPAMLDQWCEESARQNQNSTASPPPAAR